MTDAESRNIDAHARLWARAWSPGPHYHVTRGQTRCSHRRFLSLSIMARRPMLIHRFCVFIYGRRPNCRKGHERVIRPDLGAGCPWPIWRPLIRSRCLAATPRIGVLQKGCADHLYELDGRYQAFAAVMRSRLHVFECGTAIRISTRFANVFFHHPWQNRVAKFCIRWIRGCCGTRTRNWAAIPSSTADAKLILWRGHCSLPVIQPWHFRIRKTPGHECSCTLSSR